MYTDLCTWYRIQFLWKTCPHCAAFDSFPSKRLSRQIEQIGFIFYYLQLFYTLFILAQIIQYYANCITINFRWKAYFENLSVKWITIRFIEWFSFEPFEYKVKQHKFIQLSVIHTYIHTNRKIHIRSTVCAARAADWVCSKRCV